MRHMQPNSNGMPVRYVTRVVCGGFNTVLLTLPVNHPSAQAHRNKLKQIYNNNNKSIEYQQQLLQQLERYSLYSSGCHDNAEDDDELSQYGKNNGAKEAIGEEIYCYGYNSDSHLGLGDKSQIDTSRPTKLPLDFCKNSKIIDICSGPINLLLLDKSGRVYITGSNGYGQQGTSNNSSLNTPTMIEFFKNMRIVKISMRGWHCLVMNSDGQVYGIGRNDCGHCGINKAAQATDDKNISTPTLIPIPFEQASEQIVNIQAAFDCSVITIGRKSRLVEKLYNSLKAKHYTNVTVQLQW